jgi:hypothetical protein
LSGTERANSSTPPPGSGEPIGAQVLADNLDNYDGLYEAKLDAINRTNALSLFSAAGTK